MTESIVQIDWSVDQWSGVERVAFGEKFQSSLEFAEMGLDHYQLGIDRPITALIRRRSKDDLTSLGSCQGPDGYTVFVPESDIWQAATTYFLREYSITNIHELTHCLRAADYSWRHDIYEYVASEGLAMTVSGEFEHALFGRTTVKQCVGSLSTGQLAQMRDQLINDLKERSQSAVEIHNQWFNETKRGYRLGMWCVGNLLAEGASFPDIIKMDAKTILGIS